MVHCKLLKVIYVRDSAWMNWIFQLRVEDFIPGTAHEIDFQVLLRH